MKVKFEALHNGFVTPKKGTPFAAGWDLVACIDEPIHLLMGQRVAVPLGFRAEIPEGYSVEIFPRSGLAVKNGITVLNSPGLIDSDYRGEWHAILIYASNVVVKHVDFDDKQPHLPARWVPTYASAPFTITPGMKVCQMVLRKVEDMEVELGTVDVDTARGAGGFGSTGV